MVHYGGSRSWVCILMTSEKTCESVSPQVREPEKNHLKISKYRFIMEVAEVGCAF
jgi:hypothetical protein